MGLEGEMLWEIMNGDKEQVWGFGHLADEGWTRESQITAKNNLFLWADGFILDG